MPTKNGQLVATTKQFLASSVRGDTMPPPPASWHSPGGVVVVVLAPVPACWLFKTSATSWPLTFWPWKWCPIESHVTYVGYLCANFSLPSTPLCSRPSYHGLCLYYIYMPSISPCTRQTSDIRQHHRLIPPPIRGGA